VDLRLALFDDTAVADTAVADTARTPEPWRRPPPRTHDTSSAPTEPPTQNVITHLPRTATDHHGRPTEPGHNSLRAPVDGQTTSGGVPTRWSVSRIFLGRRPHAQTGLSV
jgi:hypothetical protein